MNISNTQE